MVALTQYNAGGHMVDDMVVAAIVHEVKQPLAAIIMSAAAGFRVLAHSPPDLDRAKAAFKRIVADGHRAGALIEDIRAHFGSDPGTCAPLDVDDLIQDAMALVSDELEIHRVRVHLEANGMLPRVRGSRIQLRQVLLNLVANAIDAMADSTGPRVLWVKSAPHGRDEITVSVADTGPGVGSSAVDRIFDPLFTTKPEGMGMGLAVCRSIIDAHGGSLWFVPNAPTGAVFQFTLAIDGSIGPAPEA
jgi:C4-dicarboxylate-specific signal transduction histidine kinase